MNKHGNISPTVKIYIYNLASQYNLVLYLEVYKRSKDIQGSTHLHWLLNRSYNFEFGASNRFYWLTFTSKATDFEKGEMEIFQIVRKLFLMLGIDLKQTVQNHSFHSALNFRSLTTVLIFGYGTTVCLRELLFNCDTFMEYIFAFYAVSSMILCLTLYTFVLWSSPEFIKFFIRAQNVIQESKSNFYT